MMSGFNFTEDLDCKPIILGLESLSLNENEQTFFKELNPLGFILFKRNCDTPDQVKALTDSLRELTNRNCPILIDQEGGSVQRLNEPHWRQYPPMKDIGDLAAKNTQENLETMRFVSLQMIEDLKQVGVNVNCTPVCDVLFPKTHDVIGDRAFSENPEIVSRLSLSLCRQYLSNGVMPIIKHIPGHGRAEADSHFDLPIVDASLDELNSTDFIPFRDIARSEIGNHLWAMSAHIIYKNIDPNLPATLSNTLIKNIIRDNIGFNGVLISDDLEMKALSNFGTLSELAQNSLQSGCDLVLHCSGDLESMKQTCAQIPDMTAKTRERLHISAEFRKLAA